MIEICQGNLEDFFFQRIHHVRQRIEDACQRSGRKPDGVTLIAVTKTQPPELIDPLISLGQRDLGENRVQEMVTKAGLVKQGARWHMIGHLQSNKVRKALGVADFIHSIDSVELARDVNRIAGELGRSVKIFLEVNVSGEATKFGFKPVNLLSEAEEIISLRNLEPIGLMTMAPLAPQAEASRPFFVALRELRDRLQQQLAIALPYLSMGMSNDFEVAVEEGATHVRIGTAIFRQAEKK